MLKPATHIEGSNSQMPNHDLVLPDLGLDNQQITLSLWLVSRGSRVAEATPVAELLAGAVTVDLPAPVEGVLIETLVDEGEPIAVGQRLAVIESFD
jgi:pyruvate/2-oxoglutarate dehydrogenase complex dihydrolipoamide acyltransferase (E2) component